MSRYHLWQIKIWTVYLIMFPVLTKANKADFKYFLKRCERLRRIYKAKDFSEKEINLKIMNKVSWFFLTALAPLLFSIINLVCWKRKNRDGYASALLFILLKTSYLISVQMTITRTIFSGFWDIFSG